MWANIFKNPFIVTLLLIPILIQVIWQFTNQGLPISDGGDHFRIAYLIYLSFQEGLQNGIKFVFHTGGKPILFSVFAAPFVSFAHYDMLLPIRLTLITICTLTTLAYYWLFTVRMKPIISALLAGVVMTIPFIFSRSSQFMPEAIWHLWFVLFLASLLRSNNLTNVWLAFLSGVFLALTILARPVESIVLLAPILALYFYYLYRENDDVSASRILFSMLCSAFPMVICTLSNFKVIPHRLGYVSILLTMGLLIFKSYRTYFTATSRQLPHDKKSFQAVSAIEIFSVSTAIICSVWLLFYGENILIWAYDNSFGQGAKINDQVNLSKSIISIFFEVISFYGSLAITTIFLLTLPVLLFIRKSSSSISKKHQLFILSAVALIMLPMLIAYSFTGTSDMRRIYLGMVFFISTMCFAAFGLTDLPKNWRVLSLSILILLFVTQILSITAIISQNSYLIKMYEKLNEKVGPLNYTTPISQKNEDALVIRQLQAQGITNAKIAVFSLGMFSSKVLFQAESLRYVTLGMDRTLNFSTLWAYTNYEPYDAVITRLRENGFQYVLLEGLDDPITDPAYKARMRSHTFFVHDALQIMSKNGENNLPGLVLVNKFLLDDRYVYIYKVYSPESPLVTTSSQHENYSSDGLFDARQPGWHSIPNPSYPQTITIDLLQSSSFKTMSLLPQDGNEIRSPKTMQVQTSVDGEAWTTVADVETICNHYTSNKWNEIKFNNQIKARFVRVSILSNCGDPNFLTLRGLKFG